MAKYNRNGDLLWLQQAGGTASAGPGTAGDACYSVATDSLGNAFITGYFSGTATFGAVSNLVSSGGNEIYVAKYDPNGNLLWAKRAGGANHDTGLQIRVDRSGNSYVPGFFRSTASFGSTNLTVASGSPTYSDMHLTKYDPSGNVLWAKRAGGNLDDVSFDVAIDAESNVFVTGYFQNTATFDSTNIISAGNKDIFLAKYTSNGSLLWVKGAGGTGADSGNSLTTDGTNVFLTALFQGNANFGGTVLTSRGGDDVAFIKFSPEGEILWIKQIGGTNNDNGNLSRDALNHVYVAGFFSGTAPFGETNLTSTNSFSDVYIAKYDTAGNCLWVKQAGGTNADNTTDIVVDAGQNIYLTGKFIANAVFDGVSLSTTNVSDLFLARINPDPPVLAQAVAGDWHSLLWSTNWVALLEASTNLNGAWFSVTNTVGVIGGQNVVSNRLEGNGIFYRLRVP